MSELPAPASGPSPRLRAFGTFEGYFSLVLTLIYLSLPVKNHLSWDEAFVKIVLLASAYSCGVAELVERCCRHAHSLVTRIGSLSGAEMLWEPVINQGLVRFGDDQRTDEVIAAIVATGEAFFGGTTWRGRRAMRVSVCNWQTSEQDVDRAVKAVEAVLAA